MALRSTLHAGWLTFTPSKIPVHTFSCLFCLYISHTHCWHHNHASWPYINQAVNNIKWHGPNLVVMNWYESQQITIITTNNNQIFEVTIFWNVTVRSLGEVPEDYSASQSHWCVNFRCNKLSVKYEEWNSELLGHSRKSQQFMEREISSLCSQESTTGLYSDRGESSSHTPPHYISYYYYIIFLIISLQDIFLYYSSMHV
jgi:hypothetical protein